MIKATIGNGSFSTEICFPCSETELSDKLGELGMDKEHLAPAATVIEIEPSKLSMLVDSEEKAAEGIERMLSSDKPFLLEVAVPEHEKTIL